MDICIHINKRYLNLYLNAIIFICLYMCTHYFSVSINVLPIDVIQYFTPLGGGGGGDGVGKKNLNFQLPFIMQLVVVWHSK